MTLVSVVVPAYRHAAFIGDALASVFRQNYRDIELILVDDRSPDETYGIASDLLETDRYMSRFRRIVCCQNERNLGAHNTINLGMTHARGDWISILNSDDLYYDGRIATLVANARVSGAEFLFSGVDFIHDGEDIPWRDRVTMKQIREAQANYWRFPSVRDALFHFNFCATTGNMLFERRVLDALGGFVDLSYCHDWDFIMRAAESFRVEFVPNPLYSYRLHGANSFKSLGGVARRESEYVAHGVRRRSSDSLRRAMGWQYGTSGLLAGWIGYP